MIWLLAKRELSRNAYKYIFIVPLILYFAWATGFLFQHIHSEDLSERATSNVFADLLFIVGAASVGIIHLRESVHKCLRLRLQTKRLLFLRTLPIEPAHIAAARHWVTLLHMAFVYPVYFVMLYVLSSGVRQFMSVPQYIAFALIWMGYFLVVAACYVYWDLCLKERRYFIYTIVTVVIMFAVPMIGWALGFHLVNELVEAVRRGSRLPSILSPLIGALATYYAYKSAAKRISKRDLDL